MQSRTEHHYHALPDIEEEAAVGGHEHHQDHDDELSLWDQLNDQQSREVQQHQSRFHSADPTSRTNRLVIVQSMAWNTLARMGNTATSAWSAAQQAWIEHPHRRRQRQQQEQRQRSADLDVEFGIQDLRPTSFAIHEEASPAMPPSSRGRPSRPRPTPIGEGAPNPGYPFVVLRQYPSRQAIQRPKDHWGIVANMDVFLTHLYQYYYQRGMVPMVCKYFVELLSLLFTLWLSRILLKDVDWQALATCKDEESCRTHWSDYYRSTDDLSWSYRFLVEGYTALFLAYAAFSAWNFRQSLKHAWTCQFIMHEKLGISHRKLQGGAVTWDHVVERLVHVQDSGEYRLALSKLDPLLIAQRIMRKENFLIAFWNQSNSLLDVRIGNRQYWCPSLEWCVHSCILNFMFNHKYEIRPAFLLDAPSLRRRLIVCGLVHALLLPFLILFVILHFAFRNVYDFKASEQYMGNKHWSTAALWTFREFNELPHMLERRLEPSYEAAENYLNLFGQSESMTALGKLLVFLGGAMAGVLLVLGIVNDAIVLHVQLWGRNLLWYAGIAGIVYSLGKGLLPGKEALPRASRNLFVDMDSNLKLVSNHTHYYPEHWKGRGWDQKVHGQFGMFFDSKVKLFLWELISLILAPYILIAKLSNCAPAICEFCMTVRAKVPGAGEVCGYATFDFDNFKDEAWEGRTLGASVMMTNENTADAPEHPEESLTESILRTGNLEEATRHHPKPRAREGKMEKSFFNFQAAHPTWKCSPSGQSLVDRLEEYKQTELAAISRERELYIAAAARQLETLAKWEEVQQSPSSAMHLRRRRFEQERIHSVHHVPRDSHNGSIAMSGHGVRVPSATVNVETHTPIADDADAGAHPSPKRGPVQRTIPALPPSLPTLQHHLPRPDVLSEKAATTTTETPLEYTDQSTRYPLGSTNTHSLVKEKPLVATSSSHSSSSRGAIQVNTTSSASSPGLSTNLGVDDDQATHQNQKVLETSTEHLGTRSSQEQHQWSTSPSSNPGALRAELSTELRRLLTLSTLDTGESLLDAPMGGTSRIFSDPPISPQGDLSSSSIVASPLVSSAMSFHGRPGASASTSTMLPDDRRAERQYFWLERFHEHLEHQQQQGNSNNTNGMTNNNQPIFSQSMPTPHVGGSMMPSALGANSSVSVGDYHRRQTASEDKGNTNGITGQGE